MTTRAEWLGIRGFGPDHECDDIERVADWSPGFPNWSARCVDCGTLFDTHPDDDE